MSKLKLCHHEPLGKDLTHLSKIYYGVISNKLMDLEIDRYFYTLVLIREGEGKLTQKELSLKTCLDKVFMVKVLDYLSEKGMVSRKVNTKDRREHFISITTKGEKAIPMIAKAINDTNNEALKGLTEAEKVVFYKALGVIKTNLSSMPSEEVKINFKRVKK